MSKEKSDKQKDLECKILCATSNIALLHCGVIQQCCNALIQNLSQRNVGKLKPLLDMIKDNSVNLKDLAISESKKRFE